LAGDLSAGHLLSGAENEIGAALAGFLDSRCCEATKAFSGSVGQAIRMILTHRVESAIARSAPFNACRKLEITPF
jgi:hypothetical protein